MLAGAAVAVLAATGAIAQVPPCGERAPIVSALKNRYGESLSAFGLAGDGSLVELYVSASGSWTLLVTAPRGATCLVAGGHDWHFLDWPKGTGAGTLSRP
jgi:hypothetical protein